MAVEPRNHEIMTLEHFTRSFAKARLIAVGQRENLVSSKQQHQAEQQDGALWTRGKFFQPGGRG